MKKLINETNLRSIFSDKCANGGYYVKTSSGMTYFGGHSYVTGNSSALNKTFEETQTKEAFIVNANSKGYTFDDDDCAERIFKSFIAATSTYLSKVKVAKEDEAVALVLTDINGVFKFAGIVEYHENEDKDSEEPGNWSYVLTFNEEDLNSVEAKKQVKKYLYGDEAFKLVYDKVSYDIGGIQFEHERYMYDSCLLVVDTLIGVLDREIDENTESVDIEMSGYFVASAAVEAGEKVFAIVPDGSMKAIIKSDIALSK